MESKDEGLLDLPSEAISALNLKGTETCPQTSNLLVGFYELEESAKFPERTVFKSSNIPADLSGRDVGVVLRTVFQTKDPCAFKAEATVRKKRKGNKVLMECRDIAGIDKDEASLKVYIKIKDKFSSVIKIVVQHKSKAMSQKWREGVGFIFSVVSVFTAP